MSRWVGKIAVVTGASSGIGLTIAQTLANQGMIVIGLARRKDEMEEKMKQLKNPKGKFHGFMCDISKEQNVIDAFKWIKDNFGTVSVLVNNAGKVVVSEIADASSDIIRSTFELNVFGLLYCSREALKHMKSANVEGHIVNINSVVGRKILNFPDLPLGIYMSSKFAVTAISEILYNEVLGGKIRVTDIKPGFVETGNIPDFDMNSVVHLNTTDIADAVAYVIDLPQHVQITELIIKPLGEKF
ncbi:farnesol dehydrogenase [Cephus cinctus]|uniref:Farnesol dehydrogenase n=1 Tax=Cephus cinctus TaxID=211228 RepID=A0AAJ7BHG8_CEPCN|nr:farnesol dehydrogenase [Cephus cinctus]